MKKKDGFRHDNANWGHSCLPSWSILSLQAVGRIPESSDMGRHRRRDQWRPARSAQPSGLPAQPGQDSARSQFQFVILAEVRQPSRRAINSTLRERHCVSGALSDTRVPPPYVTSATLPPQCLVGSRPGVSWRQPWRGMWAVAAAPTRSCCCTLSCYPRNSSSSPWSRWGARALPRTDGQPGGQAGLREARGRSPPTLIRWGLPPLIPKGSLQRVTGIPGKSSRARKGCLRRPPLPAEEID